MLNSAWVNFDVLQRQREGAAFHQSSCTVSGPVRLRSAADHSPLILAETAGSIKTCPTRPERTIKTSTQLMIRSVLTGRIRSGRGNHEPIASIQQNMVTRESRKSSAYVLNASLNTAGSLRTQPVGFRGVRGRQKDFGGKVEA